MGDQICYHCFSGYNGYGPCPRCGYDAAAGAGKFPLALQPGSILNGRYIVGRTLGQGGFGITYAAQDLRTSQRVAIKEYFPETLVTRTEGHSVTAFSGPRQENFRYGLQCFLSEAKTLAKFNGVSSIVRVHRYFEENSTAYFVMDYVDGISLRDHLRQRGGRLPWEEATAILFPVMDALSIVHKKGIIHRDIAPDNIYVSQDGTVRLLDFGAARYSLGDKSRSLDVMLKAGYAPKEQYSRHSRQGPYTDVYSMAATFYCAVTGRVPPESIGRTDQDSLVPPSRYGIAIPPEAEAALLKALSIHAQDRYQTMADFREALPSGPSRNLPAPVPQPVSGAAGWLAAVRTFLRRLWRPRRHQTLSAGGTHTVGLLTDGTVVAVGSSQNQQCGVLAWRDVTEVSAGLAHTVGLRIGGTVLAAGSDDCGQCQVSGWREISAVSAGGWHTLGLRKNGTVAAAGDNRWGQCNTSEWTDITAVSAGRQHTVGLKKDGTLVSAGDDRFGACHVSHWTDITAVSAGGHHTAALRADGTVVAAGSNQYGQCEVSGWQNITAVSAGFSHTVGLRADGTVVSTSPPGGMCSFGQDRVSDWSGITAVSAGIQHTVGLRADGTAAAAGYGQHRQCDLSSWRNLRQP